MLLVLILLLGGFERVQLCKLIMYCFRVLQLNTEPCDLCNDQQRLQASLCRNPQKDLLLLLLSKSQSKQKGKVDYKPLFQDEDRRNCDL